MEKIYITGHRNPDLDSLCAAYAYARLKNLTDSENEYIPIHCSPVSDGVRKQMEAMELEIPEYKMDISPKVRDVMLTTKRKVQASSPIFELVKTYNTDKPSVVPIFEGDKYKGLLSVDDITQWFLNDNKNEIPTYSLTVANILNVIPAKVLHRGDSDVIEGSILVGAAELDAFKDFIERDNQCILILGARAEHIQYAMDKQVPAIVITAGESPEIDFSGYNGTVLKTDLGTAETIRRIRVSETVESMIVQQSGTIDADELFVDAHAIFANSHTRGLAVMDNGEFAGFITRRCLLDMPKKKVIMVDHNEPAQSIVGIESADVIEIIDHHRLDAVSTSMPIYIDAEPVGSTCTIIYQQFIRHGIMPDQNIAKVLLTGITADTLILRSPTTTATDISAAEMLARLAKISSIEQFGEKLFSITDNLATQDPEKSILADFKKYESGGVELGIGQCEVTTLENVKEYADTYLEALEKVRTEEHLDWTLLMITDVLREESILLSTSFKETRDLPYRQIRENIYRMPGVMSRKKQLLPTIISITDR